MAEFRKPPTAPPRARATLGLAVCAGGSHIGDMGNTSGTPPTPSALELFEGEVPDEKDSKAVRAVFAGLRERERYAADKRYNDERDGELVPRQQVEAMLGELMVALRGGLRDAHVRAVTTLPMEHRADMRGVLQRETSKIWLKLAVAGAKAPPAVKASKEKQGERRAEKGKRRSVAAAGKGDATPARKRK